MPVTPFHIGAGLLFKAYAPARVSWVVFALVNVLIDLEPILWYLLTGDPAHRQLHSYVGAAGVAILGVWLGRGVGEAWLRWWNRQLNRIQARWLGTGTQISLAAAGPGALLGSGSHILLDSFMHADMQPYWPWAVGNGLLQEISVDGLHAICLAAAAWGGLRLALLGWITLPTTWVGNKLRDATRLAETVVVVAVVWTAASFAILPSLLAGDPRDAVAFDAAAWRATAPQQLRGNPRAPMARSTVRHLEARRPERTAALALLGPPDAKDGVAFISYHLGFLGWLSMDPDTLDIEFQPDGSFAAARIVQH
jgi:hypothetical protein